MIKTIVHIYFNVVEIIMQVNKMKETEFNTLTKRIFVLLWSILAPILGSTLIIALIYRFIIK